MRSYRAAALALAAIFAVVGLAFLLVPGSVSALFEWIGAETGVPGIPPGNGESGLFRALAVAYMYVVTLLAWMMFRRPAEPVWPALLAQAKLASAFVSILLFALHGPYLIYAANAVVDGLIGVTVLVLRQHALSRSAPAAGGSR